MASSPARSVSRFSLSTHSPAAATGPGRWPAPPGTGSPGRPPGPAARRRHPRRTAPRPPAGTRRSARSAAAGAGTPGGAVRPPAPAQGQFPGQDVGRDPGHVTDLPADLEPPFAGRRGPASNVVEVPVDEVDLGLVDPRPGPAVHDAAPLARREDPPRPAQRADVRRVETAPVIQSEVPVRTLHRRPRRPRRPRPPEGHRHDPGHRERAPLSEIFHRTSIGQRPLSEHAIIGPEPALLPRGTGS